MRCVARGALARGERLMHVRLLERCLFLLVARVAEARLRLLQYESPDDAVTLVARLAAARIGERRVNHFSACLFLHRLVAFDAFFRDEPPLLSGACRNWKRGN